MTQFRAKDEAGLKSSIAAMAVLNTLITVLISVVSLLFLKPLMRGLNVPQTIFEDAYKYIVVIVAGMPDRTDYLGCVYGIFDRSIPDKESA